MFAARDGKEPDLDPPRKVTMNTTGGSLMGTSQPRSNPEDARGLRRFSSPLLSILSRFHIHCGARCSYWCFSRLRKRRLRTKRPKVVRGDCLACHRTLVDLILNALANGVGVVAGDTSSFASLFAKPEVKPNLESVDCHVSRVIESKKQMENNNKRTLKELATPDVVYQPWCIQYPQLEPAQTYELKSGLIHLLPKFHGLVGEDPHRHLKEFHVVCSTMRLHGIPEDYIKMKVFPFSLYGAAKDWLYLQSILFNT
ncbi:hypothetical protein CR513_19173, partial [Mucuna pruriens]